MESPYGFHLSFRRGLLWKMGRFPLRESIGNFHRSLWKISMENQPRIKRHFQKAREASDVDSLHKVHWQSCSCPMTPHFNSHYNDSYLILMCTWALACAFDR
eukprot:363643-Chlamydomonas_euryale.AAC.11